jgi:hypothetical protein
VGGQERYLAAGLPGCLRRFTGTVGRRARLWATLLYAGEGAVLSHETAAELTGLADRQSALITVTVPNGRRVVAPPGVKIHISRQAGLKWRFARGIPPHTLTDDTIIDLANAADSLDDVIGWVTAAFARHLTSEWPLRQAIAARIRLRWRDQLNEIITFAAGGTHSVLEFRYDWGDVTREACQTAAQVYEALRERGYPGSLKPCSPGCGAFGGRERRSA